MVMDGGAPHCGGCHQPLQFGTDRQGRTTESCDCGYRGFLKTRPGQVNMPPDAPAGAPLSGVLAGPALPDSRVSSPTARWEASLLPQRDGRRVPPISGHGAARPSRTRQFGVVGNPGHADSLCACDGGGAPGTPPDCSSSPGFGCDANGQSVESVAPSQFPVRRTAFESVCDGHQSGNVSAWQAGRRNCQNRILGYR